MAFNYLTALLLSLLMEYRPQMLTQLPKYLFAMPLGNKYNVIFAIPSRVTQTLILSHFGFSKLLIKFTRILLTDL